MSRTSTPWAGIVVLLVAIPVLLCGTPAMGLLLVTFFLHADWPSFARYVLPAMLGWPASTVLALATFRAGARPRAWLLATVTVTLLIAVSYLPIHDVFALVHEEWKETQPGGRGCWSREHC